MDQQPWLQRTEENLVVPYELSYNIEIWDEAKKDAQQKVNSTTSVGRWTGPNISGRHSHERLGRCHSTKFPEDEGKKSVKAPKHT